MEFPVVVNWPYLAVAVLMLCYPRQWLRWGKWRRKTRRQRETLEKFAQDGAIDPSDKSVKLGRELRLPRNYIDFARSAVGALALWRYSFEAGPEGRTMVLALQTAVTLGAVLVQSVRWRERITFFAAIFFCAGLSIGMGNYYSGALALLFVCALNPVIPTPALFLTAYAALLLPFNWFLGGGLRLALINSVVVLLPVLLSVLAQRPMVIFTRKRNLTW